MFAPIAVLQEADRLQAKWYPRAVRFGILFALQLVHLYWLHLYKVEAAQTSPALLVMQQMLNRDALEGDFQMALRQHLPNKSGAWHEKVEFGHGELQGYVDFVALAWATLTTAEEGGPPEQMYEVLEEWSQFRHLPPSVQLLSKQFVTAHASWTSRNFWPHGPQSVHEFLDLLLIHVEQQLRPPDYVAGLRTAHDTLLLYIDLLRWWQTQYAGDLREDIVSR